MITTPLWASRTQEIDGQLWGESGVRQLFAPGEQLRALQKDGLCRFVMVPLAFDKVARPATSILIGWVKGHRRRSRAWDKWGLSLRLINRSRLDDVRETSELSPLTTSFWLDMQKKQTNKQKQKTQIDTRRRRRDWKEWADVGGDVFLHNFPLTLHNVGF